MKAAQSWKFHPNQKSKVSNRARYYLDFFWNRKKKEIRELQMYCSCWLKMATMWIFVHTFQLSVYSKDLLWKLKIGSFDLFFSFSLTFFFPATFSNSVSKEWPYHLFLYMHVYLTVSCFVWFSNGPIRKDNLWGGKGTKHCGQ